MMDTVKSNNAVIGYARTSTTEQLAGYEAQIKLLEESGCIKIFKEQVSSVGARPQLEAAIDYVREGDVFMVTKIDRLARSVRDLLGIIERLTKKKVSVKILGLSLDTSDSMGSLMLNVLASIAQFEREIMLERQREGIAKAKAEGKYTGRQPIKSAVKAEIVSLATEGVTKAEIAKRLKVGVATVYRTLAEAKAVVE